MLDVEIAKKDLSDWIINFLDIPQVVLNNIAPCPFAKAALIKNKINFILGTDNIIQDMLMLNAKWNNEYEGVVLIYPDNVNPNYFINSVEYVNENYYRNSGLIALEDHPLIPETVAGLRFNNNKYAIIIIQRAEKLRNATESLSKLGYYKNWSIFDIDNVINWRW